MTIEFKNNKGKLLPIINNGKVSGPEPVRPQKPFENPSATQCRLWQWDAGRHHNGGNKRDRKKRGS
jgi:hypothetical protein